ncbi:hypothetical protein OG552_09925 [Streptomyces sp. NBC_01476]|uniref:hypothetical protein n=1 Tax=Streptomyces sp. NBC_01476 TaxID=2903881 RepID=UPI002E3199E2|nr:hypothetical protein [Streptomyces sp. NBC_01476]
MSAFSTASFQSFSAVLSGQSNHSLLSWQSNGAVRSRRTDGPLAGSVAVTAGVAVVTAVTAAVWWYAGRTDD